MLSGAPGGGYAARVGRLSAIAAVRRGSVAGVESAGSVGAVRRLAEAGRGCAVQFGLVQDSLPWPEGLELVGRFAEAESVLFLGKGADAIHDFADLRGRTIGVGPSGSGTEAVARAVFALSTRRWPSSVTSVGGGARARIELPFTPW